VNNHSHQASARPAAVGFPDRFVRRSRRPVRRLADVCALAAAGCLLALVLGLGVARAADTLPFLGSFGGEGSSAGQFNHPRGVAVDVSNGPSKGDFYVVDTFNRRIEKFNPSGGFILTFGWQVNATKVEEVEAKGGTPTQMEVEEENVCTAASGDVCVAGVAGAAGGQLFNPVGVAVDPSSGDVYVADFSDHRIDKFGPAGEFLLVFGKEVDATTPGNICTAASGDTCQAGTAGTGEAEFEWAPAGTFLAVGAAGTVYVGDESRIQEFASTGQSTGQIALAGTGKTTALAIDSSGDIYAVSQALSGVRKYSPTGEQLAEFDPEREASQLTALAVQPTSGDVYVVDTSEGPRVRLYTPEGELSAESESERLAASLGIAVNAAGTVYAMDFSADRVLFFGEPPREGNPPPTIDAETVTELGEESAAVEAQINPFFLETTYRVQYAPDSGYNPSAPEPERYAGPGGGEAPAQAAVLGGGAILGDQPARLTVAGLSPGTLYHYRFVAQSSAGTTYYSPDQTFATFQPGGLAGLPDGRVYEQVSPRQKNGNDAGVVGLGEAAGYADASASGDRLAYTQDGPFGETSSGADEYSVSARNPSSGWETSAVLPPENIAGGDILGREAQSFLASADLSRFVFAALGPFTRENSATELDTNLGLYRTRGNSGEPEWLSRPTFPSFSEASPEPGKIEAPEILPVGGSAPSLGTVYFTYFGTLVPEDASRAVPGAGEEHPPWGFYEWKEGALTSAGALPNEPGEPGYEPGKPAGSGKPDPYGAVPAVLSDPSTELNVGGRTFPFPGPFLNGVSADGSKAFFVSPAPSNAKEAGAGTPTELYVREQTLSGPRTVLVSRDELLEGKPAPAEKGPFTGEDPAGEETTAYTKTAVTPVYTQWARKAYVYASPDGSRAFFESMDKLTDAGHGGEPVGPGPWTYEFNLATEKVTYLPGVLGPIAASSQDGASFIFENTQAGKIELSSGGPAPVEVASFSNPSPSNEPEFEGAAANDGAVFAFDTNTVLTRGAQTFNDSAGLEQAYRYDVSSQTLSCVSCVPDGAPQQAVEAGRTDVGEIDSLRNPRKARARAIADQGARVFFATAAKLVSRDVNGVTDVYEWEQAGTGSCRSEEDEGGCVYLISSGISPAPSFYLDNDESGDNVFFATRQGLLPGNTEESYDVYDARVNGGFPQAASPTECASSCRAPGVSPPLPAPLSTALGPSGNLLPLTRAQKLARALRACAKKPKRKRASCKKKAEKRFGTKAKAKRASGSAGRRG
jgi:DNA-binding beta-propeller fold protein YncE